MPIPFRTSPFYRVEKALSGVISLARAGPGDRKVVICNFALTESQRTLLLASKYVHVMSPVGGKIDANFSYSSLLRASPLNPQYQVRLFSTSETHYNTSRSAASQSPAYTEYPEVCEIKLNQYPVPSNTKGVKKKLGSAPPVDLGKAPSLNGAFALSLTAGSVNRSEIVYMKTDKVSFLLCAR